MSTDRLCRELPRQAVLVETLDGAAPASMRSWLRGLEAGGAATAWVACGAPGAARGCLGGTLDAVVFDAGSGFDPDAFGRACGAVRGGGVFVLLVPKGCTWPAEEDAVLRRIDAWGSQAVPRRFGLRLVRLLERSAAFARIRDDERLPKPVACRIGAPGAQRLTLDQRKALAFLRRTASGEAVPMLFAARGRGKSTVLGRHAAWLQAGGAQVVATSSSRRAASTLLEAAQAMGQKLRYLPPDRILAGACPGAWLMVDEAASIPLWLLQELLARHRAVLAGTVEGYEGTGRGVLRRLTERVAHPLRLFRMEQPVRWCAGDPLERFVADLLLLDAPADPAPGIVPCPGEGTPFRHEEIDRDRLLRDEALLRALFGLLRDAHYRTRPYDLRFLLDAPNLRLFASRQGRRWCAVALVLEEGGLPAGLAHAVALGRRRVRGHLLPQSLAYHLAFPEGARLRGWRISRIAVHPDFRRRGIASSLLRQVAAWARTEGREWLGVSFGARPDLLAFWYRNRFAPVRLGMQPETASGALPLLAIHPLQPSAVAAVRKLHRRFLRGLPWQLGLLEHRLSPELSRMLLPFGAGRPTCGPRPCEEDDRREAEAFVRDGNLYDRLPALVRWCRSLGRPDLLPRELLEGEGVPAAVRSGGHPGRKALVASLQARVAGLLQSSRAFRKGDGRPMLPP